MSACMANYTGYNDLGKVTEGGQFYLPDFLDWMSIEVKAYWFRAVGKGHPDTTTVLLLSQGEQRLLYNVTLQPLDHAGYKEKTRDAEQSTNRFIDEGGFSRTPRNQ